MLYVLCSRTEQEPYICQGTNLKHMFLLIRSTQAQWSCLYYHRGSFSLFSSLGHRVFMCFYLFFQYGILVVSFLAETDLRKEAERVLFLQLGSGLCIQIPVIL